jgi:hypothetical protein
MIQTAEIKKKSKGCTIVTTAPKFANFLSVQAQIMLKAQSRRHDKSNTRNKAKNWRKDD